MRRRYLIRTLVLATALSWLEPGTSRAIAPPALPDWTVEKAFDGVVQKHTNRSIDVDANGQSWMAYGGDEMRVAHGSNGSFTVETVDALPGTGPGDLRLDAAGVPHVAYVDRARGLLRYATRSGGGAWTAETVATLNGPCSGGVTTLFSLDLDSSGNPRVSFDTPSGLSLATRSGGTWTTELIDAAGTGSSLAIAADGTPHVCYGRLGAGLWHAVKTAGGWQQEVIQDVSTGDDPGAIGGSPSAVVDAAGHVHVTYTDSHFFGCCNYAGRYATNASGQWQSFGLNAAAGSRVAATSLAIGSNDELYVATGSIADIDDPSSSYGAHAPGAPPGADSVVAEVLDPAVAVAPDGTPRLFGLARLPSNQPLVHLVPAAGTAWTTTEVGEHSVVRLATELFFDAADRPNLSSSDAPGEIARKEGGTWVRSVYAGDALHGALVRSGGTADAYAAFMRHVSKTASDFFLAAFAGGVWTETPLANVAYLAELRDLLVKRDNDVLVFYTSVPDGRQTELRATTIHGGTKSDELVDLGLRIVGPNPRSSFGPVVAFEGPDGRAHVVYQSLGSDGGNLQGEDIRHAVRLPGGWSVEVIDPNAHAVVKDLHAAVDSLGKLHVIAFVYDFDTPSTHELRYLTNTSGSWASEVLYTAPTSYDWNGASLALVADTPHVLYLQLPARTLVDAQRAAGTWTTRVVETNSQVFYPPAQLLSDGTGRLHAGYQYSFLGGGEAIYATDDGGAWRTQVVDDGGIGNPTFRSTEILVPAGTTSVRVPLGLAPLGGVSSAFLALDASGAPHFGLTLPALNDLRYANPERPPNAPLGTVDYATVEGAASDSAVDGQDYTGVAGTLSWVLGEGGARSIEVPLIPNAEHIGLLTFGVKLDNPMGFDRTGACPEVTVKVQNAPMGAQLAYFLPKSVKVALNAKTPAKSKVTMSGTIDLGPSAANLNTPTTLTIGGLSVAIASFDALKNGAVHYAGQGLDLKIVPAKSGSSRATFKLKAVRDLTGKIDPDSTLALRFQQGALDALGTVVLEGGKYGLGKRRGSLVSPTLYLATVKATLVGGNKDALKLTAGLGAAGATPATAPDVTIAIGSTFTATVTGTQFTKSGDAFKFKGNLDGVTGVVLDYAKERLTLVAKGVDLGALTEGPQPVVVAVTIGSETHTILVRMVRSGKKLVY